MVGFLDRIVRVFDVSQHKVESTLSLRSMVRRRAATISLREKSKAQKDTLARIIRQRRAGGMAALSTAYRDAFGFLDADEDGGAAGGGGGSHSSGHDVSNNRDDEHIATVGGSSDMAVLVSSLLSFGVGPDTPTAVAVIPAVIGDSGEELQRTRYVVGGSEGTHTINGGVGAHCAACSNAPNRVR